MALELHLLEGMKTSRKPTAGLLIAITCALLAPLAALSDDSGIESVAKRAFAADYRPDCAKGTRSFTAAGETGVTITPAALNIILNTVRPDKPFMSSIVDASGDLVMKLKGWRRWQKRIAKDQPINARIEFGHEYTLLKITTGDFELEFELSDLSYNMSVDNVSNVKGWSATSDFDDLSRNGEWFDRFDVGWDSFLVRREQPLREALLNEAFQAACGKTAEASDGKGAVSGGTQVASAAKPAAVAPVRDAR